MPVPPGTLVLGLVQGGPQWSWHAVGRWLPPEHRDLCPRPDCGESLSALQSGQNSGEGSELSARVAWTPR